MGEYTTPWSWSGQRAKPHRSWLKLCRSRLCEKPFATHLQMEDSGSVGTRQTCTQNITCTDCLKPRYTVNAPMPCRSLPASFYTRQLRRFYRRQVPPGNAGGVVQPHLRRRPHLHGRKAVVGGWGTRLVFRQQRERADRHQVTFVLVLSLLLFAVPGRAPSAPCGFPATSLKHPLLACFLGLYMPLVLFAYQHPGRHHGEKRRSTRRSRTGETNGLESRSFLHGHLP